MRPPSENLRNRASTFHSMSAGGRLVRIAEENLVLDLQAAQLRVEKIQFFVDGHGVSMRQFRECNGEGEVPVGHEGDGTKVPQR